MQERNAQMEVALMEAPSLATKWQTCKTEIPDAKSLGKFSDRYQRQLQKKRMSRAKSIKWKPNGKHAIL